MKRPRLRLLLSGMLVAIGLLSLSPAGASSANISHSYNAEGTIPNGSLVSLDPAKSNYVILANTGNAGELLGVSVASNDSLLAVDAGQGSVQVATSGTVSALVSTLTGDIKVGDQIEVSPFNGIGAKATPGMHVIGLAQSGFNASSDGANQTEVTDKTGAQHRIAIGYVRLNIGIGTSTVTDGSEKLTGLQKLAKSLTGKTIATVRIVIALAIAIVTFLALSVLIYASIYGGIISIGRNPLAKFAVFRTLGSVLAISALLATISVTTIFLLLR